MSEQSKVVEIGKVRAKGESSPDNDRLAQRWLALNEDNPFKYSQGEFWRYKDGLWHAYDEGLIRQQLLTVARAARREGVRITGGLITSMLQLVRDECSVDKEVFRAAPDRLVCANGTLDLGTRRLEPWNPAHFALRGVDYAYDPEAPRPAFDQYVEGLAVSLGGPVCDFLQEFAGYCLTGDTKHERAVWLQGAPGCGKSTFIDAVKAALSDRWVTLGLADIEVNQFRLADLPGKTLAVAAEQPSGHLKSQAIINHLISGETIKIERKFKDAYDFTPQVKLLWAMNELPISTETTGGLFRRVSIVRFPKLNVEPDPTLKERIKGEGAGILNWCLDGLDRLNARGKFEIPVEIAQATAEFKDAGDAEKAFVDEELDRDPEGVIDSRDLYNLYTAWCKKSGHKPKSMMRIREDWERLGLVYERSRNRRFYRGVRGVYGA